MAITYHAGRRIQGLSTEGITTLTFEDDFSTDKGWTTTDSGKYSYNSGGWIDFDASSDQTDNRISIDIGTTLSDTAWIMRWKQEITTFVQGTQAQHLSLDIGIADREVNGATAIGIIKAHHASNLSVNYTSVSGYAVGDGTGYDSYGGTPSYPNGHVSGFTPSAKTNWVELKRTGATTVSLAFYTDSTYSTLDGSVTEVTIGSSPTGLRYVMLGSEYANQIAGNARYTGKFSELKIYDGVTSVVTETQRPTDVQVGSRYEETDTRKMYNYIDPDVTNQNIEWQSSSASSVTISGNTITRTGSDNWTDGIARSVQTISPSRGGGTLIATHSVSHAMVGLSKDPYWTSGNTYANGDYMMYHDNIYELGVLKDTFTAGDNNTLYKITMDSNGLVKYFVDNGSGYSEVYESTVTASGEYYVLGTPYGVGDTVSGNITGTIPNEWKEIGA